MDESPTGAKLTEARIDWVKAHVGKRPPTLCDVGVGGGRFVQECDVLGFDVNPSAVEWLKKSSRWIDPYRTSVNSATFWDSLEHIADPAPLLENVREWAFISAPIYKDCEHVLRSKHFRKDEHCWYWTRAGLVKFMQVYGFEFVSVSIIEQNSGREDIETFSFRRIKNG